MKYVYQLKAWPKLAWDDMRIHSLLGPVRHRQGRLLGRMEALGFSLRQQAVLQILTIDVLKSSEIEGDILDMPKVRSSIARRLGMDIAGMVASDRHVEGVVEMILDATQHFDKVLTKARLFNWHASLFPTGRSGMHKITVGAWRLDAQGPMRVVSGPIGREKVHFEAPPAARLAGEMKGFLNWFKGANDLDPVLKAGIAHWWFVIVHPFEDGNGRIARAIMDMQLARADGTKERFYSVSGQIRRERNAYYDILEKTGKSAAVIKGGIDITPWLEWFLACLSRSLDATEAALAGVFKKGRFWESHASASFNERQRAIINKLFDGFEGKLTSSKWAKIAKCSHDTALRDIVGLVEKGVLVKNAAGGRSTGYLLKDA